MANFRRFIDTRYDALALLDSLQNLSRKALDSRAFRGKIFIKSMLDVRARSRLYGKRPLDLLREGDANVVIAAATAFGEHGAA